MTERVDIGDQAVLYHGDCAKVLPTLDRSADLIVTSPPYDKLRDYGGHGFDFDRVADACVKSLSDGGVLVWVVADATVNGGETGTSFKHALGFMERGLTLHQTLYYQKDRELALTPTRYAQVLEYMFVFAKGIPKTVNLLRDKPNRDAGKRNVGTRMGRGSNGAIGKQSAPYVVAEYGARTSVWRYGAGWGKGQEGYKAAYAHPATFPLALARDHIATWTNPGDLVLDPMAGSGTVLRAAADLERDAVGIEIHADYIPIIVERLSQNVLPLERPDPDQLPMALAQ